MAKDTAERRKSSEISASSSGAFGSVFRFDGLEVDASRGRVLKPDGREELLRPKSWEVLLTLLLNRHRIVSKEELLSTVWPDVVVDEDTLVQSVVEIRKALGDQPRSPRYIRTIPKVGYRFIAEAMQELAPATPALGGSVITVEDEVEVEVTEETVVREELVELPASRELPALPPAPLRRSLAYLLGLTAAVVLVALLLLRRPPVATSLQSVPGQTRLAVLLFENESGDKELDWLRSGLTDMLNNDLSSSGRLNVLSRQQLELLLRRAGTPPGSPLSLERAVEVAGKAGAESFVLGSFTRLGDRVRIQAQLHDARSGALLFAEKATAERPELIFSEVDALSGRLLSRFGGAPDVTPAPGLAVAMTGNLEAYRLYTLALENSQAFHYKESVEQLERAIALDPDFAMAYARIGITYGLRWGDAERARGYLSKAFAMSKRLSDRDRTYIAAWYAMVNGDTAGATRAFREVLRSYPSELEAYQRLTALLTGATRFQEAIDVARRGLAVDPENGDLYNVLSGAYQGAGQWDEALEAARKYVALSPQESNAYDSLGLALQPVGRYREAEEAYQQAIRLKPEFDVAVIHLGNAYLAQGRYREAMEQYRRYIQVVHTDAGRERGHASIAYAYLRSGHPEEARREALLGDRLGKLIVAIELGDRAGVAELEPQTLFSSPDALRTVLRPHLYAQAGLARLQGDTKRQLELLREMLRYRAPVWHNDVFEDALANALLGERRYDEAIAEYQRVLSVNPRYPLARYRLGLAFEAKGDRERAREELRRFLEDWKGADPGLAELRDAASRLAVL